MAILFAIKNNPCTQILSIVGVRVGDLRKQILKLETGRKSTVLEIFEIFENFFWDVTSIIWTGFSWILVMRSCTMLQISRMYCFDNISDSRGYDLQFHDIWPIWYGYISNQNLAANSKQSKFSEPAHVNFQMRFSLKRVGKNIMLTSNSESA